MTERELRDWLASRTPVRPPALVARMDRAVQEHPEAFAGDASLSDVLANLGIRLLWRVTVWSDGAQIRDGLDLDLVALDLLAADAFVTYAIEACGEEGRDVSPLVNRLLREAA